MVRKTPGSLMKTIVREIRDSLGRYLAIVGIIALGSGLFTGLKVTKTAMLETCQRYLDRCGFFDYRLVSTVGWDSDCVEAIRQLDWVDEVEGSYTVVFLADIQDHELVLKAHTLTPGLNDPELFSGRMPEKPGECLVDAYALGGLRIGDRIRVSEANEEATGELLRCREYEVVGTVRSPLYINFERGTASIGSGTVTAFVYFLPEGFSSEAYTEIYLRLKDSAPIYSPEYDALLSRAEAPLSAWAEKQAEQRFDRLMSDAEEELQKGEEKLSQGEEEYQEGLHAYWDARKLYLDGLEDYENGKKELEEQRHALEEKLRRSAYELASAEKELQEGREKLDAGWQQFHASLQDLKGYAFAALSRVEARLDMRRDRLPEDVSHLLDEAISLSREAVAEADLSLKPEMYTEALSLFDAAQSLLNNRSEELGEENYRILSGILEELRPLFISAFGPLYDGYMALLAGEEEWENGKRRLAEGWDAWAQGGDQARLGFQQAEDAIEIARLRLLDGKEQLDDAQKQLAEARTKLEEGRRELKDARRTLEETKSPRVYVLDRKTNVGYVCFESDSDIVAAIATVFPFFFFAVAALVCVTTIGRMVDDERGQIGIMKALGYGEAAIMSRYIIYSGSASLIGCLIGVVGGSWLFPVVIWTAYGIMYSMPPITLVFDPALMLLSSLSYLVLALLVTWLGCRQELREAAAELIRPKSPPAGKRILLERVGFLWQRLTFLQKVSLRNVFRYTKRLIMMVLGIGGCTALLLTGLGLNDSITHIADRQFDEISLYEGSINFTEDMSGEKGETFLRDCGRAFSQCVFLYSGNAECHTETHSGTVSLVAAADLGEMEGLMSFHDEKGELSLPGAGECFISRNLADRYGLQTGDEIDLGIGETDRVTLRVAGIFANVIYNYVYTDISSLERALGRSCPMKLAYVNFNPEMEPHEAAAVAAAQKIVGNVSVTQDMRQRVNSMLDSMKYVVLLVIFCAGALAFIVLFNLTNINTQERIREIATLKVLGFTGQETAQYVFRENLILTFCGTVAGIPMGIWLHNFVMSQIKIDMISFEANRSLASYLLSIALTFGFTLLVNLFMLPRLERINMTEALKSVE